VEGHRVDAAAAVRDGRLVSVGVDLERRGGVVAREAEGAGGERGEQGRARGGGRARAAASSGQGYKFTKKKK
jgi:hypothetical protein